MKFLVFTNFKNYAIMQTVMKMKVKTFRNIWIAIAILSTIFYVEAEDKLLPLIFNAQVPTHYEFVPFIGFLQILPLPFALLFFWSLFRSYLYNPISKKAFRLFTSLFVFLLILPFLFYPCRTEITADTITKHKLTGQVSQVYHIEDTESVETGLSVQSSAGKRGIRNYLYFTYKINYKDGNTYELADMPDAIWWEIVKQTDTYIRENKIPKKIHGQVYYDRLLDFNNYSDFFEHRDTLGFTLNIQ